MNYEIKHCSVLDAGTEAIVNAANNYLECGGSLCGAIFAAAGGEQLEKECRKYGHIETGLAVVTPGFKTGAKYIIHAVGPNIWQNKDNWQEKLKDAYNNALTVADFREVKSIALPCISTGIYSCPLEEATEIAIKTISEYTPESIEQCIFCCYTEEEYETYLRIEKKNKS